MEQKIEKQKLEIWESMATQLLHWQLTRKPPMWALGRTCPIWWVVTMGGRNTRVEPLETTRLTRQVRGFSTSIFNRSTPCHSAVLFSKHLGQEVRQTASNIRG